MKQVLLVRKMEQLCDIITWVAENVTSEWSTQECFVHEDKVGLSVLPHNKDYWVEYYKGIVEGWRSSPFDVIEQTYGIKLQFEDDADAIKFKLIWG